MKVVHRQGFMQSRNRHGFRQCGFYQRGVVLITALVFLVILTLLSITALSTNTLEERMAANSQDVNRAFQAAESGISDAFTSGNAFTGTTNNFTVSDGDNDIGNYSANTNYTSAYRTSMPVEGFQDIDTVSDEGLFRWHYYDIRSTGATQSGASSVVGAGARVMGR